MKPWHVAIFQSLVVYLVKASGGSYAGRRLLNLGRDGGTCKKSKDSIFPDRLYRSLHPGQPRQRKRGSSCHWFRDALTPHEIHAYMVKMGQSRLAGRDQIAHEGMGWKCTGVVFALHLTILGVLLVAERLWQCSTFDD